MEGHIVCDTSEIESGDGIGVTIKGIDIAVFNVNGEFYAMQNTCRHKDGPMYKGEVDEESGSVFCPWHWWEWDLETGKSPVDEEKRLRTFETWVEDDKVIVEV